VKTSKSQILTVFSTIFILACSGFGPNFSTLAFRAFQPRVSTLILNFSQIQRGVRHFRSQIIDFSESVLVSFIMTSRFILYTKCRESPIFVPWHASIPMFFSSLFFCLM
jgi:hypothetical protein